jgi:hypothetical protein
MKTNAFKFGWLTVLVLCAGLQSAFAQTRADIFNKAVNITWLGMDFTQAKFIGSEAAYKNEVINAEFVEKYIPAWAGLFLTEPKTYNPAKAVHRDSVSFAYGVTEAVNSKIAKNFFDENPSHFNTLKEADISKLVSNYDFQGHKGIGMMFFVDGLSKARREAGVWVTFVNMNDKTVLLTVYRSGGSRGFGFRNYWAHSWYNILKGFGGEFDALKRQK